MKLEILSTKPGETKKLGFLLAKKILAAEKRKSAALIGLAGELGGGKTTFAQGFAKGLGIKERILSPTFTIMKKFRLPGSNLQSPNSGFQDFYHFDCYRVETPKEILSLGFKEIISNPKNIVAVEWADKIKNLMPKDAVRARFKFIDKNHRAITIWLN